MATLVQGTALVVCSIIIYIGAFYFYKQNQFSASLSLLILGAFILRAYTASDAFLHEWDERYHALVAKHLMHHFLKPTLHETDLLPYDFRQWTTNTIWLHKQPMALWLIAISFKIFGVHDWAVRIPGVLFSCLTIVLVYQIASSLYPKKVALLASFLCSIHGLIIELCSGRTATDHVDTVFLFFMTAGIWACLKYHQQLKGFYIFISGLCLGFALLTKWLPALLILAVWVIAEFAFNKLSMAKVMLHLSILIGMACLIALPWQYYIYNMYPKEAGYEWQQIGKHFYSTIENNKGSGWFYINHLRMEYGELIYLPIFWYAFITLKFKQKNELFVLSWFLIPYITFSLAATKMPAFTIIAAPAIFIITAVSFFKFQEIATNYKSFKWLLYAISYSLILLPIRYSIERLKPFENRNAPAYMTYINYILHSNLNNKQTVILNSKHAVEIMFYTNCTAYEQSPSNEIVNSLQQQGYKVVLEK